MAGRYFPTSMKEINPAEGTETVHLDITLDPGAKVRLRVVDQQGKPVTGVKIGGRRDRGRDDEEAQAQAEFDVVTLGPGEDRMVWLVHEGRKLGRVIHIKEGDDKNGPVVVALEPSSTITGRVVDPDGNPISGATITPYFKAGGSFPLRLAEIGLWAGREIHRHQRAGGLRVFTPGREPRNATASGGSWSRMCRFDPAKRRTSARSD